MRGQARAQSFSLQFLFGVVWERCNSAEGKVHLQIDENIALGFRRKSHFFGALGLAACLAVGYYLFDREVAPKRSIAVLPFVDLSPAKDQEYFSDGITEQITNSLGKVPGLFVVGRTSAFVLKNRDVREVGRRLRVSNVIEGSISGGPNEHRIDVRLVNVNNGYQVWSDAYNSSEKDFLELQSEVARKVAAALQVKLGVVETEHLAKPPTEDPEAYDLYLRGRYLLNKRTAESIQTGLALFQQAIARDPKFALGMRELPMHISCLAISADWSDRGGESRLAEVSLALALDDQLSGGYVSRAILLTDFEWNWPAGRADYQKAMELNPNSASAHHWYARHLAQIGRFDEALREVAAAQKLDPLFGDDTSDESEDSLCRGASRPGDRPMSKGYPAGTKFCPGVLNAWASLCPRW